MKSFILFVILVLSISSQAQKNQSITIMAYNVENLFDWQKDPGKNDQTYLPLEQKKSAAHIESCHQNFSGFYLSECLNLDWSEAVVREKIHRIVDTLESNSDPMPDILILEEVENERVLQLLNQSFRTPYSEVILLEGDDKRGIDVAILTRFAQAKPAQLHRLPIEGASTRGILEATLQVSKTQKLTVYGAHFPSQSNPTLWRQIAIQTLNDLMTQLPSEQMAVAGGDFNISKEEDYFRKLLEGPWKVSHIHGCKNSKGSYVHKGQWQFIDALLFKNMKQNLWQAQFDQVDTLKNGRYQLTKNDVPARFSFQSNTGVSDHLPIFGVLELQSELSSHRF